MSTRTIFLRCERNKCVRNNRSP